MHIVSLILGALMANFAQLVWATDSESLRTKYKEDFDKIRIAFEKKGKPKFHQLANDMRTSYDNLPADKKMRLEKRGLVNGLIEEYVNKKLAAPLYRLVEKRTAVHIIKAVEQHKRELRLMKRDGVQLSKRELEARATKMSEDIAGKVEKDMIKASAFASEKFQSEHIKSYQRSKTPDGVAISYGKRSLMDPNSTAGIITSLVVGIILSFAMFPLFGITGFGVFAATAVYSLVIQPLVNKIMLGHFLWADEEKEASPTAKVGAKEEVIEKVVE